MSDENKIPLFDYLDKEIPLDRLSGEEFEKFVLLLFQDLINVNHSFGDFDSVSKLPEGPDGGRDLVLFNKQKVVGVVQCKKSKANLGDKTVLKEIVKICLHSILHDKNPSNAQNFFIPDKNNFTHITLVSSDFTSKATLLIETFNRTYDKGIALDCARECIKKYTKLSNLVIDEEKDRLLELLDSINIKGINNQDITTLVKVNKLTNPLSFFKRIPIEQDNSTSNGSLLSLSQDEIKSKFSKASLSINSVKSFFGGSETQILERQEVQLAYDWVFSEIEDKDSNLSIIAGDAGYGKSVIVKQLYEKLIQSETFVLCLKADRLAFGSTTELEQEISIDSLHDTITALAVNEKRVVLIIDQLDALSQSLSSDLKPLYVYNSIIKGLLQYQNIRIIVSCRTFELNYDPILSNYKANRFIVKKLELTEVDTILNTALGTELTLDLSLKELLRIPLHLEVFLQIYHSELNLLKIESIQDLYDELWERKIIKSESLRDRSIVSRTELVDFLYEVCTKMYDAQKISLPEIKFRDQYADQIAYLKSEGILNLNEKKKIEFFHQSFFDYVYARNSVSNGQDILQEIKKNHQGLFIRSKVKQVLAYLRSSDPEEYINSLNGILSDDEVRFHIKLLALQFLSFQETIISCEKDLMLIISKIEDQFDLILGGYLGIGWLDYFLENSDMINEYFNTKFDEKRDIIINFVNGFIPRRSHEITRFLHDKKEDINVQILKYLLRRVEVYDDDVLIKLCDEILVESEEPNRWGHMFLTQGIEKYPDWVSGVLLKLLDKQNKDEELFFPTSDTEKSFIYNKLWESHSRVAYSTVKSIISTISKSNAVEPLRKIDVIFDKTYMLYERKNLTLRTSYEQLDRLQSYLENSMVDDSDFVKTEVRRYLESEYVVHILIGLSVIEKYPEELSEVFISYLKERNTLISLGSYGLYSNFLISKSLGHVYNVISLEDKDFLRNYILSFSPSSEQRVYEGRDGDKKMSKSRGRATYQILTCIDESVLEIDPMLPRFKELKRKFGKYTLEEPKGIVITKGDRNALPQESIKKISKEDWLKSFFRYDKVNPKYNRFNDPDMYSHGDEFKIIVSDTPDDYFEFVRQLITNSKVSYIYAIKGIEGLKEGRIEVEKLRECCDLVIQNRELNREYLYDFVRVFQYFPDNMYTDDGVFDFLKKIIFEGDEVPGISGGGLNAGINSVRGVAVQILLKYSYAKSCAKQVFETLDYLTVENSNTSTRACALFGIQYFLQYDIDRVLELVLKLSSDYKEGVLDVLIHPFYYLIEHKFEEVFPILKNMVDLSVSSEVSAELLTISYCRRYFNEIEIFDKIGHLGKKAIHKVILTASQFWEEELGVEKAKEILMKYLSNKDEDIASSYSFLFNRLNPNLFTQIYDFLEKYVMSSSGSKSDDMFFKFLGKASFHHPEECIELISKMDFTTNYEDRYFVHDPLKVIISSYNAIREYKLKSNDSAIEKCMNLFDKLLQDKKYSGFAYRVVKDIDSYN